MIRSLISMLSVCIISSMCLANPLPISGYSIEMPSMGVGPMLRIATTFPANFPQTAHDGALFFNCGDSLSPNASDSDWKKWQTANHIQVGKDTLKIGATTAKCDKGKLTIQDPKLYTLLTPQQYEGKLYNSGRAGFLINSSTTEFKIEFPTEIVFSRKNNLLTVSSNTNNATVAFRQNSDKMNPLSFQGKSTPGKIDFKKSFSVHITLDGGATWQNMQINFVTQSLSFWVSSLIPDGPQP